MQQFVESARKGTDFHRRHLEPGQRDQIDEARRNMSASFEIVGWDRFMWSGQYEYHLRFDNGASGVVFLTDRAGERTAALVVGGPSLPARQ